MRRALTVIAAVGAGIAFFPTGGEAQDPVPLPGCTPHVRSPEEQARYDLVQRQLRLRSLLNVAPLPGK